MIVNLHSVILHSNFFLLQQESDEAYDGHRSRPMGNPGDTRQIYPNTVNAFQIENGTESLRWTNWMDWSSCTKTCGFGISIRTRDCVTEDVRRSR